MALLLSLERRLKTSRGPSFFDSKRVFFSTCFPKRIKSEVARYRKHRLSSHGRRHWLS